VGGLRELDAAAARIDAWLAVSDSGFRQRMTLDD
jgi:hypothetical protein